eukprot:CAMPEP_0168608326 /NCGR_PEP_ID=MMETSP0449_2-20121227/563_1 /TAXON_ID=1082188 /ORGANISM="Strombidium rassoulzadegani, Strain ras09" /LENGTH=65 /DNA_ID=CAMNT_0008648295 /DNA_START=15 /DNA_END=212 /DNA_ORIENTATION=+
MKASLSLILVSLAGKVVEGLELKFCMVSLLASMRNLFSLLEIMVRASTLLCCSLLVSACSLLLKG